MAAPLPVMKYARLRERHVVTEFIARDVRCEVRRDMLHGTERAKLRDRCRVDSSDGECDSAEVCAGWVGFEENCPRATFGGTCTFIGAMSRATQHRENVANTS